MEFDELFDAFSDDEAEAVKGPTSLLNSLKRPMDQNGEPKKRIKDEKTVDQQPIVVDDFEEGVEKQYSATEGLNVAQEAPLVVTHKVRHQVALPPDYKYIPLSEHVAVDPPARTYPFTLDPFQQTAVISIDRGESVLVSAHTSAGKTVVAEYAIAKSLRDKQRVIYTSPIKALSNQKYRELQGEFGDVGLMTGDVTINPDASCLVMTTEILRSMLYRGSEVMREVAWVVFDEIHYMRDPVRGVVWEETIILLPDSVRFVFLSATIPNAMQFAEWICKIHKQPCHVVYTDYRPTPLQHYLFPAGGEGIHLAVDEQGSFREDNFQKAIASLGDAAPKKKGKPVGRTKGPSDLYKILRMIMVKNYHPVIVFSFSKRECEGNALQLSKLDLNIDSEKEAVQQVFDSAVASLSDEDRQLPQIQHILPLLKRGIGIHHSGLLPVLKEVIEILFQEGLLKVLFATETFSIGLNMPAKTVVFTAVRKFDGYTMRWLGGGEYIQMSGRAGRRGLDDRGIVILMVDEKMEPAVAKGMLKGQADYLHSAFHLTYTMILNLIRIEGIKPEQMLEGSFFQFQSGAKIPQLAKDLEIYQDRLASLSVDREDLVSEYYSLRTQLEAFKKDLRDVMNHPSYCLPFLQPGRLARIRRNAIGDIPEQDFGYGIIVDFHKTFKTPQKGQSKSNNAGPTYMVDVLLYCARRSEEKTGQEAMPCPDRTKGVMIVVPCDLSTIDGLSSIRAQLPSDIKSAAARAQCLTTIREIQSRFNKEGGIPLLDPIKDMKITDESFQKLVEKIRIVEPKLLKHPLSDDQALPELYAQYEKKVELATKIKQIKKESAKAKSILQLDELKGRRRVLRRLGYVNDSDVIDIKGRVACEISAGDELMLTELLFNGAFNDLTPEQCASMLTCFVGAEKSFQDVGAALRDDLAGPFKVLKETAKRIAKVSQECKLTLDEAEYVGSFRPELMDVVYSWAQGAPFAQICKMTDIFEGSIIRAIRRLDELLQQLVKAARNMGNTELEEKFEKASTMIKRNIVFAASLYL